MPGRIDETLTFHPLRIAVLTVSDSRDLDVFYDTIRVVTGCAGWARVRGTDGFVTVTVRDPDPDATIDQLSEGRAEIMVGRGSFIESFPLFGYELEDYNDLFTEKLDLLLKLRDNERVTWSGKHRAPLHDQAVYPRPYQDPLPIGIAVGGTPA